MNRFLLLGAMVCALSASPMAAQLGLGGLLGSLIVTLTSPSSGSTVSGTTPVSAGVTIVGLLTVSRVEFYVDGTLVGTDTSSPYSISWDTRTAANGTHRVAAAARDILGIRWWSNAVTVTVTNGDTTPPTVAITAPTAGITVSGTTPVTASASDNLRVAAVEFFVDGTLLGTDTSPPYAVSWNTTSGSDGSHTLTARARDDAGNAAASAPVAVTVANGGTTDTSPPVVTMTSPANGATVSGTITIAASASDNVGVAGVQFFVDGAALGAERTTSPYTIAWDTTTTTPGSHVLTARARDVAGNATTSAPVTVTVGSGSGTGESFQAGDVLVSLETGPVQWRRPDGTLRATLNGSVGGLGEGMAFDALGNLYVARWRCPAGVCTGGNTVERFDPSGQPQGTFGSGYNCDPHAIVFDAAGAAYVGEAGCRAALLKFAPGSVEPIAFPLAPENLGVFWIDLAPDGCTIYYTSAGPNVKRYNVCTRVQLPDFNAAPLPGGTVHDVRVLPDGGVIVSSGDVIARLNASGALVQTYAVPGEVAPWAGLDLVGDGTFWAGNYESSNVYRFDLATGAVLTQFNTGTPPHTVVGVRVKK